VSWGAAGLAVGVAALILALASVVFAGAFGRSAHGNRTVLPNQCASCHIGHGSPRSRMMPQARNAVCLRCHGDAPARESARRKRLVTKTRGLTNIAAEFRKPSRHPLDGVQRAKRRAIFPKRPSHIRPIDAGVSCIDCHNPHYGMKSHARKRGARTRVHSTRDARGRQQAEYKLCYRCHASAAQSSRSSHDIRQLLRPSNPSYHPVVALGRNEDVPSLIKPLEEKSFIACSDCHGSDQALGPGGPHGSAFKPILKAHYQSGDGHVESTFEYALCYRCHSRSIVLGTSSFREHRRHVVDVRASCRACHNSHGSVKYKNLIDFDTRIVSSNSKGRLDYADTGVRRGECNLLCHGRDHDRERY